MSSVARRARLKGARRIPLTVTIDELTHSTLAEIAGGNRSAAIEALVRDYLIRPRRKSDRIAP